jgi:hypothetical protein
MLPSQDLTSTPFEQTRPDRRRPTMKKRLALVAMAGVLVTFGVGAAAVAGASSKGPSPAAVASPPAKGGVVKAGSTWTLYYLAFTGGSFSYGPCEVISFEAHGVFQGDKGDVGKWSGNLKASFTNNTYFPTGTFQGKYFSNLSGEGVGFQGADNTGNNWSDVGPLRIYQGDDPVGIGTC